MSDITNLGAHPLTMTSREIAELTGKLHKHVLEDIRKMLDELLLMSADFSADIEVPGPNGGVRTSPGFKLPKRETLILVSGYNVELRARIIDRWQELEAQPQHLLPQTFAQALRMLADKSEELEAARPAIEFVQRHVEVPVAAITFRDLAKKYKVSEPDFRCWLIQQRICFMQTVHGKRCLRPYKEVVMSGHAELKTEHSPGGGFPYEVVYFTSSGQVWLDRKWTEEKL